MSSGGRHHAPRRRNGLARRTRLRRAAPRDFSAPFYASLEFRRATDLQLSESVRRAHRKIDAAMPGVGERPVLAARTDRFPAEVRIEPGCARGEKGAIAARPPNAPRFLCAGPAQPGSVRPSSAWFGRCRLTADHPEFDATSLSTFGRERPNVTAGIDRQKNRPAEAGPSTREVRRYFVAPPSNHAAIFVRSSSVMCVTLPIGIAFNCTAC
ncbi:ISBma2, transposase [Burkholderia pseudomallei]|nr:ISBma2, transposase [Burkholderia pseudomallei]